MRHMGLYTALTGYRIRCGYLWPVLRVSRKGLGLAGNGEHWGAFQGHAVGEVARIQGGKHRESPYNAGMGGSGYPDLSPLARMGS